MLQESQEEREDAVVATPVLDEKDLKRMLHVVDEFKTRHSTITQSINDTYMIGNKLLDYVEKQVIIDFHLKGQQSYMEEKYPKLTEKAKKFLGMQAYFDMSVAQIDGMPMSINDPYYEVLMKK